MPERNRALLEKLSTTIVLNIQLPDAVLAADGDEKDTNTAPTLKYHKC